MGHLEDLSLLVSLVEHGSFTVAARHSSTSQPRVSRAIARLEAQLGVVLVRRTPRRVQVTQAGRELADQARQTLKALNRVEVALRGGDGTAGPLVLSTPPALGRRLVAPLVAKFCREHPGVQLRWSLSARRVDLVEEEVDVAVRFEPLAPTWQRVRRLLSGQYHVYGAPGLAAGVSSPQALARFPCLGLHSTHRRTHWPFVENARLSWVDVAPEHWTDDADALIALGREGLGLLFMPDFLVANEVREGRLERRTEPEVAVPADLFATSGFQTPTPRAQKLIEELATGLACLGHGPRAKR